MKDEAENGQIEKEEKPFIEEEAEMTPQKIPKFNESQPT